MAEGENSGDKPMPLESEKPVRVAPSDMPLEIDKPVRVEPSAMPLETDKNPTPRAYLEDGGPGNPPVSVVVGPDGREVNSPANSIPPMPLESDQKTYLEATDKSNSATAVTVGPEGVVSETKLSVYREQGNNYVAIAETPGEPIRAANVRVYAEGREGTHVALTEDAQGQTRVAEGLSGMEAALQAVKGMKFPEGMALSEGSATAVAPNGQSGERGR